ncbi:MAG TPA: ferrochelatase [Gemmatimonadales bacterium]
MSGPIGVLVMAYGGPDSLDEVEPYLLDVRGHRPTPTHIVEEIKGRYARIGGRSPILGKTRAQASALQNALVNGGSGRFATAVGMRHWQPRVGEALTALRDQGIDRVVALVMAPHYSSLSIDLYFAKVDEHRSTLEVAPIREWHLLPGLLEALADRIRTALQLFPEQQRARVPLLFTAHSLPRRILEAGDPYPAQLAETMRAVLDRLGDGRQREHRFAYQSAGRTGEPWLGPTAEAAVDVLAAEGHDTVLIVPIGFTCEHVEVLYDVDIELREHARQRGVRLERIEMVNDHPAMISGLAETVRDAARARGWL